MCFGAKCSTCSKQSWRGCGSHLPSVFANVKEEDWCVCEPKVEVNGTKYPPQAKMAMPTLPSWMKFGGGSKETTTDNATAEAASKTA
ncbi:hypothetical protein B0H63DRAFT_526337 [Podospora didyma]|uniref:Uncharacterized protein n=1 Tax=Podospora didyma TaxID=330526 RepID=A0AAE0KFS1_9PEZI|nr:hypothetical protein B0H63DRAFT_526337 [Podospora didyma]